MTFFPAQAEAGLMGNLTPIAGRELLHAVGVVIPQPPNLTIDFYNHDPAGLDFQEMPGRRWTSG